jgi:TonB family protein
MNMRMTLVVALAAVMTTGADTPALYKSGSIPTLSVMSVEVGGGEVLLEVTVGPTGAVTNQDASRNGNVYRADDPGGQDLDVHAVRSGDPGGAKKSRRADDRGVETKVLVAGVFRRPSVIGITLGEPIKDVAYCLGRHPLSHVARHAHVPAGTMSPGVVLVEVQVDARGGVSSAKIRVPSPGFDSAAVSTAQQWKFRPARPGGANASSVAYIVFGFPVPKG